MTDYGRAGFGENRSEGGGQKHRRRKSRSGGGRLGVTTARDDVAVDNEGVCWTPARKDGGTWQNGWELLRERLKNAMKPEGPRLFVFNNCRQFIRIVPVLPRDEIDMDDVDSKAEEHVREDAITP